ncbi:MAG: cobalt ECF transporter T component CbiQ [Candidatus Omnitrophica bacterium]|nr:cobalt ECF transporter T component CbiQ [Candidatus Omnitrophota bacterium]
MAKVKNADFIERSIMGALSFLKEAVFSDEYASKNGLLQSLDPRIKLATFAVFLCAVLFTKSIPAVLSLYIVSLALARLSGIDLGFFLKRTWIFIPLFSFFIAVPAIFSVFTPGDAMANFKIIGLNFVITRQGFFGAVLFLARVITSVSFAVLLSITTKHFELLKSLRTFGVPQVFVMILGICYRYIYLFTDVVQNTYLAIRSRVGARMHHKKGRQIVAWNMASLWHRSYRMNEEVYNSMLARGYTGEPVTVSDFKTKTADWVWLFFVIFLSAAVLYCGSAWEIKI